MHLRTRRVRPERLRQCRFGDRADGFPDQTRRAHQSVFTGLPDCSEIVPTRTPAKLTAQFCGWSWMRLRVSSGMPPSKRGASRQTISLRSGLGHCVLRQRAPPPYQPATHGVEKQGSEHYFPFKNRSILIISLNSGRHQAPFSALQREPSVQSRCETDLGTQQD
jgi:hypothetical protein